LERLVQKGSRVIIRIPLIPTYTMDEANIDAISANAKRLNLKEIHILPFHQFGSSKYQSLGWEYALKDLPLPSDEEVNAIKSKLERSGLHVVIGGE